MTKNRKQEHDNTPSHDAHVTALVVWMKGRPNYAPEDAARIEMLLDWHSSAPSYDERPRDFKAKILATHFIKALKYTHIERRVIEKYKRRGGAGRLTRHFHVGALIETLVDRVDAALNEYHRCAALREEQTKREKRQREQARGALVQIQKQFAIAEENPLLGGAILAAFRGFWGESHCELRQSVSQASDSELSDTERDKARQDAFKHDDDISEIVRRLGQAIDAMELPKSPGGRPAEPELDRLILKLADIVVEVRAKGFHPIQDKELVTGITRHSPETVAHIAALMKAGNVPRAPFSIAARLEAVIAHHPLTIPIGEAKQAALPIHNL